MIYKIESHHSLDNDNVKAKTGKTMDEWFSFQEENGGLSITRRDRTQTIFTDFNLDIWWSTTLCVEYEAHKGKREKDGLYKGYCICSTKTISTSLDRAWTAWTHSDLLGSWFGPSMEANTVDGGMYKNADCDQGKYLRVRVNKDLRFTFENPDFSSVSLVDVVIQDKGNGKCYVQVTHDRIQTRAEADGIRDAWAEALSKLKAILEG